MRIAKPLAALGAALVVASCVGAPVISDISTDKVRIIGNNAPVEQIQAKADEACAMYKRRALALSQFCGDQYCIQKHYLFACRE